MTRTGLIAALVMGTALAACAERPVAIGKNSNQAPQIGTAPMAPTADGAVRVSGGAVPGTATTATLSPGSERPKAPVAVPVPPTAAVAPASPPPVAVQAPPPPAAPAIETQALTPPPAPAPVAVAAAPPAPMQAGTVGQTLAAAAPPPPAAVAASPPILAPPPVAAPAVIAPAPVNPLPVAIGNQVPLPAEGVTPLPPPPSVTLPAVILPPNGPAAPVAAQGISAPQPPLPPVLVAVAPTALPGKDLAEQLSNFAAKAQPGATAQVNDPGQPSPMLLRLDREYFAASGRACREISGRTSTADVTYVVCQQESGWSLIPALMRSRPLPVN